MASVLWQKGMTLIYQVHETTLQEWDSDLCPHAQQCIAPLISVGLLVWEGPSLCEKLIWIWSLVIKLTNEYFYIFVKLN